MVIKLAYLNGEIIMKNINFGSTFRIPVSQPGVNSAKKERLKQFIASYENGLIGSSKTGYARVSISDSEDADFVRRLKQVGYKIFQKFDGENIPKNEIDSFIKTKLNAGDFSQSGKNKKPLSKEQRLKKHYDNAIKTSSGKIENDSSENSKAIFEKSVLNKDQTTSSDIGKNKSSVDNEYDKIRASETYLKYKNLYGEAFAEAVFFNIREH